MDQPSISLRDVVPHGDTYPIGHADALILADALFIADALCELRISCASDTLV